MIEKIRIIKQKIIYKVLGYIPLKTKVKKLGVVLLSYDINPFFKKKFGKFSPSHTNQWECYEIAQIFLKEGYDVDVIKWDNSSFVPKKKYSIVLDILSNLESLTPFLNKNCKKIMFITSAHWKFHNNAEEKRLDDLNKRKGIKCKTKRTIPQSKNTELADYLVGLGNRFTQSTYSFAKKNIHYIPISTNTLFESPKNKNFKKCNKKFIWLGGGGLIHKGLDLVLETFANMPDYHLTVCGPIKAEPDFEKIYYKELYNTKNIKTIGFIDVSNTSFKKIISDCVGLIYPSCSEGQSGSVITCMHAGLIPIISYQSGVDVENFGIILKKSSLEEIKNSVIKISNLTTEELKNKAMETWEYANKNHTREKFTEKFTKFIKKVIKETNES